MDCWDLCRFVVTIDNGQIIKLEGDPNHPVTRGFVCKKGKALIQRFYNPDRIVHPMMKKNGKFVRISYEQAFDIIVDKLVSIKEEFGTKAVLSYTSDGYGGLKNQIQDIFFNYFGGVTKPEGSLCWGAGIAAQKYDFGNAKGHFPDDVLNSDTILLWGRNPKETSIHLYTLLKQAQKDGSRIIVIDPVKTSTARAFGSYIRINPSTDAAFALAMANYIIENNFYDKNFIEKHVLGFQSFQEYAAFFTLQRAEKITGISSETIKSTALQYAEAKTASIYIGLGMQRYHNGGNSVRSIDALGAVTGKIGKKGCGVNYAAVSLSQLSEIYLKIDTDEISWENKVFKTPSARIELYSEKALQDGFSPLPSFIEPCKGDEKFPLRLLTCHTKDSMHSQGFAFNDAIPKVYLNQKTVQKFSLEKKYHVFVKGRASKIEAELCIDESVGDNTAFMYQGFWQKNGAVNHLTTSGISDMGQQAAYYDSFCSIESI